MDNSVRYQERYIPRVDVQKRAESLSSMWNVFLSLWLTQGGYLASAASTHQINSLENVDQDISSVCDRVKMLDKELQLPRKLLAKILHISRTTLYDLLNDVAREYRNESRLKEIEIATRTIRKITTYPIGRSAILVKKDGISLAELLDSDNVDHNKLEELARVIDARKEKERSESKVFTAEHEQYLLTRTAG